MGRRRRVCHAGPTYAVPWGMGERTRSTGGDAEMRWTVDDAGSFVHIRTEGQFSADGHLRMARDILGRPFWSPGRDVLFDHRALSFRGVRFSDIREAADNHRAHDREIGDGRAAIVMKDLADYGVGRMFDGVTADSVHARLRIFLDLEEAIAWLTGPG